MRSRPDGRRGAAAFVLACLSFASATAVAQHRVAEALLTSATPTGPLPASAAEAALRTALHPIAVCVQAPFRVGSMELHATLVVGAAGRVTSVTMQPATFPRDSMRRCVSRALRSVRFPALASGASTVEAVFEINW